jgi:hypothetical protein
MNEQRGQSEMKREGQASEPQHERLPGPLSLFLSDVLKRTIAASDATLKSSR